MAQRTRELLMLVLLLLLSSELETKAVSIRPDRRSKEGSAGSSDGGADADADADAARFCLSWRLAVEANNVVAWPTVPRRCSRYVESYMVGGQYDRDLELIAEQILGYVNDTVLLGDSMDAWILDVDDTCISNIYYYKGKQYGYVTTYVLFIL